MGRHGREREHRDDADLLGLNGPDAATTAMGNYHTSPGYQFALDQGLRATDAGAAAKGMLRSGATLKAEQTFGTGLADQDFTNYYNRLFDLSKLGESAAAGTGAANISTGQGIASTDLSAGSALTNIYGNAASGIGNAVNNYANNSIYGSRTNALMGGNGTYASTRSKGHVDRTEHMVIAARQLLFAGWRRVSGVTRDATVHAVERSEPVSERAV